MAFRHTIVFRVVLANPLTTEDILQSVLQEQREIAAELPKLMTRVIELSKKILGK